jgi:hypothetical protein
MLNWQTVSGRQNLPRDGDRIIYQDESGTVCVGVVGTHMGMLCIIRQNPKDYNYPFVIPDGMIWALSERKEKDSGQ